VPFKDIEWMKSQSSLKIKLGKSCRSSNRKNSIARKAYSPIRNAPWFRPKEKTPYALKKLMNIKLSKESWARFVPAESTRGAPFIIIVLRP
jgi:hypothetical protein